MSQDLTPILREWAYEPENNIRKIWGDDGSEKIQIRVDQGGLAGLLQMDLEGRPDGKKPYGFEFVLDYYQNAREKYRQKHGDDAAFHLDPAACAELFDESMRIYHRYVFLLQIGEYARILRDTERNMRLFRFVNTYAVRDEDRMHLERWWPYILRIHAVARIMIELKEQRFEEALAILGEVRERILGLPEVEAEEFHAERERSIQSLNDLEERIHKQRPLSEEERLERRLDRLVKREAYEQAAEIRDRLRQIREGSD